MTGARGKARFPRSARLTSPTEFQRVLGRARRSADECFTVLARSNDRDYARLGLAVSRKVARKAVVRNRIKRIVRESFRNQQRALGGFDIVVMARPAAARRDAAALRASLHVHWTRIEQWANC